MKFSDEVKRLKTKEFWRQVSYWSSIKWSGKKLQPIAQEDWLPLFVSALIGVVILLLLIEIYKIF